MTARLATEKDTDYIIARAATIRQLYSPEWAKEIVTSPNIIAVVDPPTGMFWAQLTDDPTVVLACITVAADAAQATALYKAAIAEALVRWPKLKTLRAQANPAWCTAPTVDWITSVAKMPTTGITADGSVVYEKPWAELVADLQVKVAK